MANTLKINKDLRFFNGNIVPCIIIFLLLLLLPLVLLITAMLILFVSNYELGYYFTMNMCSQRICSIQEVTDRDIRGGIIMEVIQ